MNIKMLINKRSIDINTKTMIGETHCPKLLPIILYTVDNLLYSDIFNIICHTILSLIIK